VPFESCRIILLSLELGNGETNKSHKLLAILRSAAGKETPPRHLPALAAAIMVHLAEKEI
jgi:hypothetical protein